MLGYAQANDDDDGGLYGNTDSTTTRLGVHTCCELCERERLCLDQYGLTVCSACHHEFLPGGGML